MINNYLRMLKNPPMTVSIPSQYQVQSHYDNLPSGLPTLWLMDLYTQKMPQDPALSMIWKSKENLHVFCLMKDNFVFTEAEGKNDRTWEKGDVMEFFIQPNSHLDPYFELHVAPNKATLELSIPNAQKLRDGEYKIPDLIFNSGMRTSCGTIKTDDLECWWGHLYIPLEQLQLSTNPSQPPRFAICRYNYNKPNDENPELSASCLFPTPAFHQPHCWHTMSF